MSEDMTPYSEFAAAARKFSSSPFFCLTDQAIPLQPVPRGVHLVSNIEIDDYSSDTRECIVSSHFIVLQYQRNKQAIFGGSYTHTLRWDGDSFAIKQKKADLANCEASHESIHVIL